MVLAALLLFLAACQKETSSGNDTAPLKVSFRLLNDGQPLTTTDEYVNSSGERYTVRVFKFYVSAVELSDNNTISAEPESYHLVNLAEPESKELNIPFRVGTYKKLGFTIGVDSTRNVSGAQTGALDPALGMFWTWNTGYIFAKLEGNSPVSTAPSQAFTYHIGGFRTGENAIRKVSLEFPANQPVVVGKTTQLVINVDLAEWFSHVQPLSIAANPSIMTPGGVSLKIADNYAGMFSIQNIVTP